MRFFPCDILNIYIRHDPDFLCGFRLEFTVVADNLEQAYRFIMNSGWTTLDGFAQALQIHLEVHMHTNEQFLANVDMFMENLTVHGDSSNYLVGN